MKRQSQFARVRDRISNLLARLDPFLMGLGFAYLGIYSVEVLSSPPAEIALALEFAGWLIYGLFLLDLAARLIVWFPQLREFSGWIGFLKENWLSVLAAALPAFRSFRVFRVLIVLRGIYPYVQSRMAKVTAMVGVALPLIIYTSSLAVLEAERGSSEALIDSFGDALWWSMVTITTVGYGDTFPLTPEGRFVGTFLIFTGIGLFSTVTALIASWVLKDSTSQSSS